MYDIKIDTVKKIWDSVLEKMESQLDVNAFNTFFLPIVAKEIKNNKLLVEAPTRFVKEVVSSEMFVSKINACLKELTNTNLELEVKEKSARDGVNPKTGEKIEIEACKAPTVKFSKAYKEIFN